MAIIEAQDDHAQLVCVEHRLGQAQECAVFVEGVGELVVLDGGDGGTS